MKQTGWLYVIKYIGDGKQSILSQMYDTREECSNACTDNVNELLAEDTDKVKKVLSSGVFPVYYFALLRGCRYGVYFADGAEYRSGVFDKADDLYDDLYGNLRGWMGTIDSPVNWVEIW